MESLKEFLSPTTVFFLITSIGYVLGKIKVFGFSLDLSAVLLVAVVFGYMLSRFFPTVWDAEFNSAMGAFSKIGTAHFVSAVGVSTGGSILKNKSFFIYFSVGAMISFFGFISAKVIGIIDSTIDTSLLMGIFCGAMTTTPGLAVLCESDALSSNLATLGYGIAYVFGVVAVVLFVQRCPDSKISTKANDSYKNMVEIDSFLIICIVALLGFLINTLKLPFINISLGTTGSMLLSGILIGCSLNFFKDKSAKLSTLSIYRNFGLIMFFVGNGTAAGKNLNAEIQIRWLIYGILITVISILTGNIMCILLRKREINRSVAIAGGMTSTPALNVILKKSSADFDMSGYSFAYFGALITIVLCLKFLIVL